MMNRAATIWMISAATSLTALASAVIEGEIRLPRAAVPPPPNSRYQIKASSAPAEAPPPSAVVYLEGDFSSASNRAPVVRMEQKNFQFHPGVLPIQKGTVVEFPNLDEDYHNVFSFSKVKRFDLGRYRKDEKPATQTFSQPGVVKLYCEIHEHMRGAILVVDTPYFTVTDASGKFRLDNLPAGNFTLKVWVNEKTTLSQPVALAEGQTARIQLDVK